MTTPVTPAEKTIEDMDTLRHMLGVGEHIKKANWGYRNYFNAEDGHHSMPSLIRLQSAGLIEKYRPSYWRATEAGCRAIGLTGKQIERAMEP
jgi:hypothetical protein